MNGSHRFHFDDRHQPLPAEGNPLMPTAVRPVSGLSAPSVSRTNGRDVRGTQDTSLRSPATTDISLRQAALVAGVGLLLMTFLAPIANFGVLQKLIVPGDAAVTAQNIAAAPGLFRLAIGTFF